MSLEIVLLPCRTDNYAVLFHDGDETVVIDTPDGAVIDEELTRRGWRLTQILTTHHHGDHTAGHSALKAKYGCRIVAPAAEADKIPGVDLEVAEGDTVTIGSHEAKVIATPGHTKGHIAYHLPADGVVFVGDTLFALGCGRLLEDTPAAMWASLQKLAKLPPETRVYCGHEYTVANARFALTVEPDNARLAARAREVASLREHNEPTIPTTIGLELATNPFVRAGEASVKRGVGMPDASDVAVFTEVRARKDRF